MKQIFTLFAVMFLVSTMSIGQTNFSETFEGKTAAGLTGWMLTGTLDVNSGSQITSTNSLRFDATNSSTTATVITSGISVAEQFLNVSFKYKSAALNGSGTTRTINYGLLNGTTFTSLGIVTLTPGNNTAVQTVSTNTTVPSPVTLKLEFRLAASNDQNADLFLDDLRIITTALAPLPIKLLSFTGSLANNKAKLTWSVADNETGERFEIEKSLDGRNYTTEAVVFTTEKEGTDNYYYNATQEIAENTSYRLKIINKNKTTSYSRIIYLKKETSGVQGINLLQNPIGSSLAFSYEAATAGTATVNVYNTAGLKVYSFNAKMQKGTNTIIQAVDNKLTTGNYILEVATTTERRTIKIAK